MNIKRKRELVRLRKKTVRLFTESDAIELSYRLSLRMIKKHGRIPNSFYYDGVFYKKGRHGWKETPCCGEELCRETT